jgi:hypothetical protein
MLVAAVAINAFLAAFGGTWTCTATAPGGGHATLTRWTIAAVPHSSWARVSFERVDDGGTAFVGYLPLTKTWLYEDFHDDGSFATNASPGPADGVWTFRGSYTTAQHLAHYAVQWRRDGNALRRGFGRLIGASFRENASDRCRR